MSGNLFIGFTPYHAFLSIGLNAQFGMSRDTVMMIGDSAGAELIADVLKRSDASPFHTVQYDADPTTRQTLPGRVLSLRKNSRRIARHLLNSEYNRIVVFNEQRPESQAAIYWSKRAFPATRGYCAEDGWTAYLEDVYQFTHHPVARVARKLAYGFWWEDVATAGGYSSADGLLTVAPKAVNGQRGCPVMEICRDHFFTDSMQVLAGEVLEAEGFSTDDLSAIDAVVFLARSTIVQKLKNYPAMVTRAIGALRSRGMRVAIKYHPREPRQNPYGLDGLPEIVQLPAALAAEFLLINADARFRVVLGDITTSLMTAKWLFPESSVLCFKTVVETLCPDLASVFSRSGILLVDDLERALAES